LEAQLGAWCSQFPAVALMRRLQAAGIPAGAAYSTVQVLADVHFTERGFFQTIIHPALGATRMEGIPFKAQSLKMHEPQRPPLFGEHTRDVLHGWLDMDDAEIDRLSQAGALS
jgi:crotonobetainyl-CoA:carnitine CoA-transferase CaiB-like acyl-CoA transferase